MMKSSTEKASRSWQFCERGAVRALSELQADQIGTKPIRSLSLGTDLFPPNHWTEPLLSYS